MRPCEIDDLAVSSRHASQEALSLTSSATRNQMKLTKTDRVRMMLMSCPLVPREYADSPLRFGVSSSNFK